MNKLHFGQLYLNRWSFFVGCFRKTCKIEHFAISISLNAVCGPGSVRLDLQQCPAIHSSNGPHLPSHKTNTWGWDNPDLWHPSWAIIIMTVPLQQLLSEHTTHLFMTSPLPSIKPPQHFPTRRAIILYNGCSPEHHHICFIFLPATQNNTKTHADH